MRRSYKIFLLFLFIFSIYCSLTIGRSWDEEFQLYQGKVTLNYLSTFGSINTDYLYREFYAPFYWTINYLLTQLFPDKYRCTDLSGLLVVRVPHRLVSRLRAVDRKLTGLPQLSRYFCSLDSYPVPPAPYRHV